MTTAATAGRAAASRLVFARSMTEAQLQRHVLAAAAAFGLWTAHFRPARTADGSWRTPVQGNGKGFPDLVIAGPGGVLFAELKSQTGQLTGEQEQWRDRLEEAGAQWRLWRPLDWMEGRVQDGLRALTKAGPQ